MSKRNRNSKKEMVKITTNKELFRKEAKVISRKYGFSNIETFFNSLLLIMRREDSYVRTSINNGSIGKTELNLLKAVGFTSIERREITVEDVAETLGISVERAKAKMSGDLSFTMREQMTINELVGIDPHMVIEHANVETEPRMVIDRLDQINSNIEKLIKVIEEV